MNTYFARQTEEGIEIFDLQGATCAVLTSCTPEVLAKILDVDLVEAQGMLFDWDGRR